MWLNCFLMMLRRLFSYDVELLVELSRFYRSAFCVVVFVILDVLIHLVCGSCFVLMKFVSMFLFKFDFGVVCCFAGFVSWFALSYDRRRLISYGCFAY